MRTHGFCRRFGTHGRSSSNPAVVRAHAADAASAASCQMKLSSLPLSPQDSPILPVFTFPMDEVLRGCLSPYVQTRITESHHERHGDSAHLSLWQMTRGGSGPPVRSADGFLSTAPRQRDRFFVVSTVPSQYGASVTLRNTCCTDLLHTECGTATGLHGYVKRCVASSAHLYGRLHSASGKA